MGNEICVDLCVVVRYQLAGLALSSRTPARVYLVYGLGRGTPPRPRLLVCPQAISRADMLCTLKTCHFVILVYTPPYIELI